ncbi:MAG: sulfotransferase [Myxococcota bacterium]
MPKLFGWTPPTRPAWVKHLNAMGEALGNADALVPIHAEEMVAAARASTGLSDFGPPSWRVHYDVLVKSIQTEAQLTPAGRLLTRSELMRSLRNRLFVEDYLGAHPEALEAPVTAPIVVCGYGRSGTSITHELLALDPSLRAPMAWELFDVSPLQDLEGARRHDRIRYANGEQLYYEDVTPEFKTMHENGAELPVECLMFQMHEFLSAQYFGTLDVPTYMMHAMASDRTSAYQYEYRMLQVMQHQRPGTRWVLKGPTHQERLEVLFSVFPDALVVHLHRDPRKMIPSSYSLMGTLRFMRSDHVDLSALEFMPMSMQMTFDKGIQQRADGAVPTDQICDLLYADLVQDPVEALRRCYAKLALPFSNERAAAITRYIEDKPKGKHGAHDYTLEEFGLDGEALGTMFSRYQAHYGVPDEVAS